MDTKKEPLAVIIECYLLEEFTPKTLGLDFWQLKRAALQLKRSTKKATLKKAAAAGKKGGAEGGDAAAAGGSVLLAALRSGDCASILAVESNLRTAMFSVLAKYTLDDLSRDHLWPVQHHTASRSPLAAALNAIGSCLVDSSAALRGV